MPTSCARKPARRAVQRKQAKEWRQTEAGQASSKASDRKKYDRKMADPALRLMERLQVKLSMMLSGQKLSSKTVAANTEFKSAAELAAHLGSLMPKSSSMTMDNYGAVWHIEHAIARCWYDPTNPEDVRRCWSKANIRPMLGPENLQKGILIDDDECMRVGEAYWPSAWLGVLPTCAQKERMYKGKRAGMARTSAEQN